MFGLNFFQILFQTNVSFFKFSGPNFFIRLNIFSKFFFKIIFRPRIYYCPKIFGPAIFLDPKVFRPKIVLVPINHLDTTFFKGPKFLDQQFNWTQKIFDHLDIFFNPKFFWTPNLYKILFQTKFFFRTKMFFWVMPKKFQKEHECSAKKTYFYIPNEKFDYTYLTNTFKDFIVKKTYL